MTKKKRSDKQLLKRQRHWPRENALSKSPQRTVKMSWTTMCRGKVWRPLLYCHRHTTFIARTHPQSSRYRRVSRSLGQVSHPTLNSLERLCPSEHGTPRMRRAATTAVSCVSRRAASFHRKCWFRCAMTALALSYAVEYASHNGPRWEPDTNYLHWSTDVPAVSVCRAAAPGPQRFVCSAAIPFFACTARFKRMSLFTPFANAFANVTYEFHGSFGSNRFYHHHGCSTPNIVLFCDYSGKQDFKLFDFVVRTILLI